MSNMSDIAGGIKTVIEANTANIKVYDKAPLGINHFPAVLVFPDDMDPNLFIQGNSFEVMWKLIVLTGLAEGSDAWGKLYDMMDPTETDKSIIKALRTDNTLNGKADSSNVEGIRNAGLRDFGGNQYAGFDVMLQTLKSVA
jgi:hypothetical protein